MKDLSRVFKALGDETRLQLMALILSQGELCVCDCMQVLEAGQSKVSRHLRYLVNAGLLSDRREAVWVYYKAAEKLDADRSEVLDLLKRVLPPDRIQDLIERLVQWRNCKSSGCATGTSPRTTNHKE